VKVWDGTPVTPAWQAERPALADRRWEVWQQREAEDCLRQQQWFAARWHLDHLIAAAPEDSALYAQRGRALVELGRWAEADGDFARAAATGSDIVRWFYHALLRLHLGDPEGYRSTCARVLAMYEESESSFDLQWIVIIGDLAPDAVADPARLVRAAERLATFRAAGRSATLNPEDPWSDLLLGRALYRAGRYEETVKRLQKRASDQNLADASYYWIFLALAHEELGHANEAQTWLGKAESWLDAEFAETYGKGGGSISWYKRLEIELLLSEARALIRKGHPLYLPANVFQADPTPPRPLRPTEK
jgi:predicted Zn-dependent protease